MDIGKDEMEELKNEIEANPNTEELHVNRLPKETAEEFRAIARQHFAGDYGWLLKWLLDREMIRNELYGEIDELQQELAQVKQAVKDLRKVEQKEEDDSITRLNG